MHRSSRTLRRAPLAQPALFDAPTVGGTDVSPAPTPTERTGSSAADDRRTLDGLLSGVWEGLSRRGAAPCPLCDGLLVALDGQGADARCVDCGTTTQLAVPAVG